MSSPTSSRLSPIGVAANRRLLRGYGPFVMLAVLVLGMAVLVPSKVQTVRNAGSGVPAGGSGGGVDQFGDGASADGATGEGAAGPAKGGAATAAVPAGARPCSDRALQIPNDPYSPPCVAFSGSNGGATWRGVTPTEIHFSLRTTADASLDDAIAQIVGSEIADTPADVARTTQVLVDFFNKRFQFYGRKMVIDNFNGQGSIASELVGQGRDKAEVDATRVAGEIKAFGDLTGSTEPYGDALSRQGVMNFGTPILSREWYEKRRPYSWSILPDCSTVIEEATEYVLKRLSGGTATSRVAICKGRPRRITILGPENSWYQECVRAAEQVLNAAGHQARSRPDHLPTRLSARSRTRRRTSSPS